MADFSIAAGAGTAAGFFIGILGHEVATARAAEALGDRSGRLTKRTSLSPKAHADPLGTIVMPAIFTVASLVGATLRPMFGWGKRHQINQRSFRNIRRGVWLTSLAGPAWTIAVAAVAGVGFRAAMSGVCVPGLGIVAPVPELAVALYAFAEVCVYLTIIELLPIPGRDGARILGLYLSPRAAYKMEELVEYEVLFLLAVFIIFARVATNIVSPVVDAVTGGIC